MIIYKITNLKTSQVYIGSTVSFKTRKKAHITDLNENKHHNYRLQSDWKIYGEDNFKFEILEKGYRDKQSLLLKEYELINSIKECYYNIDRICPIIKPEPIKKKNSKINYFKGKKGSLVVIEGKKKHLQRDWIDSKLKKPNKKKNNPIPSFKHLDSLIDAKKERELNKIRNRELLQNTRIS